MMATTTHVVARSRSLHCERSEVQRTLTATTVTTVVVAHKSLPKPSVVACLAPLRKVAKRRRLTLTRTMTRMTMTMTMIRTMTMALVGVLEGLVGLVAIATATMMMTMMRTAHRDMRTRLR
eukprot:Lithocolla_globosa_v1_NODE_1998_length_2216_cov_16.300787.p3 type:complete len:121 gc:universal NODE_1998_length_2216_cov_16.300787:1465-1103(-)